ncbi:ABC transporter substrate-binding protein [Rapidithrix thailandica]|uniref:ABC transporter substrate-binding protein n=1 Tax=Rapidithrix thailandica TaxID=413964 RepID=A0AAW9S439_9BACT
MRRVSFIICIVGFCILSACNQQPNQENPNVELTEAKGGKFYGGVFRLNEPEYIKNLFPHSIIDIYSYRIASQIYEGLFKFDQDDLSVQKCLVNDYEIDSSRTQYTFYLKDKVFFHDDDCFPGGKGRKMTAEDVKYCFQILSTQSRMNQSFHLFDGLVLGASEYYEASANGNTPDFDIEGIQVLDELTLRITLEKPNSQFLYNLARPGGFIFPREAYDAYKEDMRIKCVGTGPFEISSIDEDNSIILKKNKNYYDTDEYGNPLPFLDAISITFIKDKKIELMQFRKGKLDMVYRLPSDFIIDIVEKIDKGKGEYKNYELQRTPEMSTQLLAFNTSGPVFGNVNVRKAFSFAIDREKIMEFVLKGEGYLEGYHGMTPPSFPDYDIARIKGYTLNLDSAQYYLAKAGYPNGEGFPKIALDINSEGKRFDNVANEIQKQLKENLNVEVELQFSPIAQIAEKSTSGNYNLLRLAWIADYPGPENYLWAFYGKNVPPSKEDKSYPNLTRYQNPEFDKLYEKALGATTQQEALEYFLQAEQIMIQDAPALILWYDEGYRLVQSYVKSFANNPMQFRDFSAVYFIPKSKKIVN